MLYANFILEGSSKTLINKLIVQQNNALRAVLDTDCYTPRAKLYTEAGVDPVDVIMKKTLVKLVYKGLHNIGAPIYNSMFNYSTATRDLRSNDLLLAIVPKVNTKFGENNMSYRGPIYYNSLPYHIKSCSSFECFKCAIKKYDGYR